MHNKAGYFRVCFGLEEPAALLVLLVKKGMAGGMRNSCALVLATHMIHGICYTHMRHCMPCPFSQGLGIC
jgi:hypothetical protein